MMRAETSHRACSSASSFASARRSPTPARGCRGPALGNLGRLVDAPVMYAHSVQGLLRSLGPLSSTAKQRLKALGVDPDERLEAAYSREKWLELINLACELTFPGVDKEEASYQLGRRFMGAYAETLVGKAMLTMLRVIGPKRSLERMSRNFRTGNNFSQTRVSEPSPGVYELWCSHVSLAGWYRGIIEAGLERAGANQVRATLLRREDDGAVFRVQWT